MRSKMNMLLATRIRRPLSATIAFVLAGALLGGSLAAQETNEQVEVTAGSDYSDELVDGANKDLIDIRMQAERACGRDNVQHISVEYHENGSVRKKLFVCEVGASAVERQRDEGDK